MQLSEKAKSFTGVISSRRYLSVILFLIALSIYVLHFIFFRHSSHISSSDEASFFSPSVTLIREGRLATGVHATFLPDAMNHTYWMPPLYLISLAGFMGLIGISIFNAKLLSFVLVAAAAFLITQLVDDHNSKWTMAALFLVCPYILQTSAFIRMESLAILLMIISMLLIYRKSEAWLVGLLAALCIMTHPLMIPCAVALSICIMLRGWKPLSIFMLSMSVALMPYIGYIWEDPEMFWAQMKPQLDRKYDARPLQISYIAQTLPFAMIGFVFLYWAKCDKAIKLFLFVALGLSLIIVLKSNEYNYQAYLMPYFIACLGLMMNSNSQNQLKQVGFPIIFFVAFGWLLYAKAAKYNFRTDNSYKMLVSLIEKRDNWRGKNIYVEGDPDVAAHMISIGEEVERQNGVAKAKSPSWHQKFNYVMIVQTDMPLDSFKRQVLQESTWTNWPGKEFEITKDGRLVLFRGWR